MPRATVRLPVAVPCGRITRPRGGAPRRDAVDAASRTGDCSRSRATDRIARHSPKRGDAVDRLAPRTRTCRTSRSIRSASGTRLMETARFGGTTKGGIRGSRFPTRTDRCATGSRPQCEALGCTVTVDEVGNMFARRPGKRDEPAADLHGLASRHPADRRQVRRRARRARRAGGDAHAARAAATRPTRRSRSSTGPTRRARASRRRCWPPASSPASSRRDYAYARADRDGKTFGDELERIGYRGTEQAGRRKHRRHVRAAHRAGADPRGRGAR